MEKKNYIEYSNSNYSRFYDPHAYMKEKTKGEEEEEKTQWRLLLFMQWMPSNENEFLIER